MRQLQLLCESYNSSTTTIVPVRDLQLPSAVYITMASVTSQDEMVDDIDRDWPMHLRAPSPPRGVPAFIPESEPEGADSDPRARLLHVTDQLP